MKKFSPKDPDSKLDYVFDWAAKRNNTGLDNWLDIDGGESIVLYEVVVPEGLNKVSDGLIDDNTAVCVWINGGTSGEDYVIECKITTQFRTDVRSIIVPIRET